MPATLLLALLLVMTANTRAQVSSPQSTSASPRAPSDHIDIIARGGVWFLSHVDPPGRTGTRDAVGGELRLRLPLDAGFSADLGIGFWATDNKWPGWRQPYWDENYDAEGWVQIIPITVGIAWEPVISEHVRPSLAAGFTIAPTSTGVRLHYRSTMYDYYDEEGWDYDEKALTKGGGWIALGVDVPVASQFSASAALTWHLLRFSNGTLFTDVNDYARPMVTVGLAVEL